MREPLVQALGVLARRLQTPGRSYLARLLSRIGPDREITYRDQWGFRRVAVLSDYMEALGFVGYGVLTPDALAYVSPGSWAIDVGANVGRATAQLCHLTRPGGVVWAIEPFVRNAERLRSFQRLNRLGRLSIYEGAASDHTGHTTIYLHPEGKSAFASLSDHWQQDSGVRVATWRLDDLVFAESAPEHLTFLKLDVEGWEPQVLAGAERTLHEKRPIVHCEFNDVLLKRSGSSSAQLLDLFGASGYRPSEAPPLLADRVVDLLMLPD